MAAGSGDRSLPCVRPGNKYGPLRPGFTLSSHNFRPHVEAVHDVAGRCNRGRYRIELEGGGAISTIDILRRIKQCPVPSRSRLLLPLRSVWP
jgi:hypothetical protein